MTYSFDQRSLILRLARESLEAALNGYRVKLDEVLREWAEQHDITDPAERAAARALLDEPRGCFVTLRSHTGSLRGCIGTFAPPGSTRPLSDHIIEMAAAASRDPRFVWEPVRASELPSLHVEVSVLTPLQQIADPTTLRLGVDGIYMIYRPAPGSGDDSCPQSARGKRPATRTPATSPSPITGCFLPQVAPEQGWNLPQMLDACCEHKMGLPPDTWRRSLPPPTPPPHPASNASNNTAQDDPRRPEGDPIPPAMTFYRFSADVIEE